ncbi:hypothetical protein D9613_012642 [Agrocybe pediades]|uniref:Uncharacterized protein n=1 Tax=Agrocybe pediades TaxID=84607 RepID=A0A8H4VQ08_9AGAR|nr:hypothetical protein D9613_012642 [Agrocybe pediades]
MTVICDDGFNLRLAVRVEVYWYRRILHESYQLYVNSLRTTLSGSMAVARQATAAENARLPLLPIHFVPSVGQCPPPQIQTGLGKSTRVAIQVIESHSVAGSLSYRALRLSFPSLVDHHRHDCLELGPVFPSGVEWTRTPPIIIRHVLWLWGWLAYSPNASLHGVFVRRARYVPF